MKSFESSEMLARKIVGLFHRTDCFFFVIRVKFLSPIFINEVLPLDVALKISSSVQTNETDTRFRKLSQNFPKVEFGISL